MSHNVFLVAVLAAITIPQLLAVRRDAAERQHHLEGDVSAPSTSDESTAADRVGLVFDGVLRPMLPGSHVRSVVDNLPDIPPSQFYATNEYMKIAQAASHDYSENTAPLGSTAQNVLRAGPACRPPCVTIINMVEPGSDRGAMLAVRNLKASGPLGEHVRSMGYMLRDQLADHNPEKNRINAQAAEMIVEFNMKHIRKGHDQRIADAANVGMADLIVAFRSDRNIGGRGPAENTNFGMFGEFGSLQARFEDHIIGGPVQHCVKYKGMDQADDMKQMVSPRITIFNKGETYNGYDWTPLHELPEEDYPKYGRERFNGTANMEKFVQNGKTHPMKSNKDVIVFFLKGDKQKPMQTYSPEPSAEQWARVIADKMESITKERGLTMFNLMTAGVMDSKRKGGIAESTTAVIEAAVTMYLKNKHNEQEHNSYNNSGRLRAQGEPGFAGLLLMASLLFYAAEQNSRR